MRVVHGTSPHKLSVGGDTMHPSEVKLAPEAERIVSEILAKIALRKLKKLKQDKEAS